VRRGFSQLELLIAMGILTLLLGAVFAVFEVGSSGYRLGNTRLDLQSDLRRVSAALRTDIRESSFPTFSSLDRQTVVLADPALPAKGTLSVRRDGMACNSIQPNTAARYAADTGLPRWDCYALYLATLEEPEGQLIRALVRDDSPGVSAIPLENWGPAYLTYPAIPNVVDDNVKQLTGQLLEFAVELQQSDQLVSVRVRLRGRGGRLEMGRKSVVQVLEANIVLRPANTWPKL
jgi:hypothetical protein